MYIHTCLYAPLCVYAYVYMDMCVCVMYKESLFAVMTDAIDGAVVSHINNMLVYIMCIYMYVAVYVCVCVCVCAFPRSCIHVCMY
jgi:hypothetical protein